MKKTIAITCMLAVFFVALASATFAAQWANPELLMSAKEVKAKVGSKNWIIVDCRDLKDYAKGHIEGAISFGKRCKKALRDTTSRVFPDTSVYEKLFGKVGISNDSHLILYGEHAKTDTVRDSAVAFWIFEVLGHVDKVHVMNGGIDDWKGQGYSLTNKPTKLPPATYKVNFNKSAYATTDEMIQIARGQKKGIQTIDSRTEKENKGKDIRALRGGRLPYTTMNVSHKKTWDQTKDRKTGKMKDNGYWSPERLDSFFGKLDRNTRTIAYCQTGTRSAMTYFELRLMGFKDAANWDESWRVYASHPELYPVENEEWFDFNKVRKLEKDMKKLKKKLAAMEEKEGKE